MVVILSLTKIVDMIKVIFWGIKSFLLGTEAELR